jgi:hypothetical protein
MSEQETEESVILDKATELLKLGKTTEAIMELSYGIHKLMKQRDLYAAQAKWNAQTVIRQANEIRRLEGSMARLQRILEDWGIVA